ncbi:endolytic transglycosylase MltG [Subtercola sp. YIM 133946]|uniref:endolytic transglycosylase MltG n=1 Tax=Subtercola sp. YIM 133946 TaxID=3118909 RepID=UPI002F948AD0
MTDSKLPENHPFAEFFRDPAATPAQPPAAEPQTRRAARAAQVIDEPQAGEPRAGEPQSGRPQAPAVRADEAPTTIIPVVPAAAPAAHYDVDDSAPAVADRSSSSATGTGRSAAEIAADLNADRSAEQAARPAGVFTDAFDTLPPQTPAETPRTGGTPPAGPPPGGRPPRDRSPRQPKRRRSKRGLWALIIAIVLVGGLGAAGSAIYFSYEPQINKMFGVKTVEDYSGTGTGEQVSFVINSGDDGSSIGDNLQAADIIKSSDTFYALAIKNPSLVFQPGTYTMQKQMSAQAALDALDNPANAVTVSVVVTEGMVSADILSDLADKTGVPLADLQAEAANYTQFGIDASAPNIEGYLFPATYTFQPNTSAHDLIKTMVDRAFQSLDAAGVAPADREKVLTMASIVQKEGGSTDDFYKVSRVFANRIADGMPLQSDATVAYGTGSKEVDTTDAQRNDESNPYNTYVLQGLPAGPISNPGDAAIDAALHPADGTWLYFVTVNLDTGLTCFSDTIDQHDAAVQLYQAGDATSCP